MNSRQAALTSVGEFLMKREAYDKAQQLEWERCRWSAWSIIRPFAGKNAPNTPIQWVRFPWESAKPTTIIKISESQIVTLNDIFNDFKNRS